MGFKRITIIMLLILLGGMPGSSLAQTNQKSLFEMDHTQPPIEKPTDVNALPIITWDSIKVNVVEGNSVWLALRTNTPVQDTSGIKIDVQLYTENDPVTGADIDLDFERTIFLPQTNQSRANAITGYITGTSQVLYIQLQTVSDTFTEKNEVFYVDVIISNGTIESRGNRATITIVTDEKFYPAFADWQSCDAVGEPDNNTPVKSGFIATSGGACKSDFVGENPQALDYYRISQAVGGNLTLQLKNTTGQAAGLPTDQHDFDLYLYKFNSSTNQYEQIGRSINRNQLDDVINLPIVANTSNNNGLYLVGVYWAVSTGNKTPTYELSATLQ